MKNVLKYTQKNPSQLVFRQIRKGYCKESTLSIIFKQTFAVNDKKNKIDDEHCLTNFRLGHTTVYGWITYKKAKQTIRQDVLLNMKARK